MVYATQFLDIARDHIGEKYVLGAIVPMANANWRGPWDCAEFITFVVYRLTGKLYGFKDKESYTGYWAEDANAGRVLKISVSEAVKTAGAVLLRKPKAGMTGHIAFSDGRGGTIEARGKAYGVCKYVALDSAGSNFRNWDTGIKIPDVNYDAPLTEILESFQIDPLVLTQAQIIDIQKRLPNMELKTLNAGALDEDMATAIYNFQLENGLEASGHIDQDTLNLLK